MTVKRYILPFAGLLLLPGCDAATQIAGDAVQGEVRNAITAQCRQVAEGAGIVAGQVAEVCECTAATFADDPDLTLDDASPQRIEAIVNQCAAETGGAAMPASEKMTAE